ncbi:DUF599 family protein [Haematospirillum jordaniae]|uniref:DUF599 domain-containing protein n=1 Tax=Haematospirillum jordaniae TaxID=1549855 RepID=A0A143DDN7_9PROT|nr:DUF599 domain-containing protein [Haematospirillum jordaniae]AMW34815.1 hypothetical protein AY555_06045 [Haematospirillum jordaniae]NKD45436.1 DUF599 family protein [Haematospirillum jordaniae]NKD56820.1 DUF599 family protein [Haematospirillum jordaniae]NKD59024.1 DUF599 family protein [Haematospirillum jordaniae]NKD66744.1 DUF599 family protein [Haematospirillum jordaniae]
MNASPLPWMTLADWLGLASFFALWTGYTIFADISPARHRSIATLMASRRRAWFMEATRRDLRIVDANILGNLLQGVSFFSSTTIFVIGGLMAMLGVTETVAHAIGRLPFAENGSIDALESKICFLLAIFVYAFFKFSWAFRLANYCSITVGALGPAADADSERSRCIAETAAVLSSRSGHHFNRGLRAYFFALGALGWMVNPLLLTAVTAGVVVTLYRREFHSLALQSLSHLNAIDPAPPTRPGQ